MRSSSAPKGSSNRLRTGAVARRIREYIDDIKASALQPEIWTISQVPLPEWMEWALGYADSIDPVAPIRKARRASIPNEDTPCATSRTGVAV